MIFSDGPVLAAGCFLVVRGGGGGGEGSTDFPDLPAPLTPRQIIEKLVSGSVEGSPTVEHVAAASLSMPDLSREGPFDVHQDSSRSCGWRSTGSCFRQEAVQTVALAHRVRRAAHYMTAMGLWCPPSTQGIHGPLPSTSCNMCMSCADCFPDLPQQQLMTLVLVQRTNL